MTKIMKKRKRPDSLIEKRAEKPMQVHYVEMLMARLSFSFMGSDSHGFRRKWRVAVGMLSTSTTNNGRNWWQKSVSWTIEKASIIVRKIPPRS